MRKHISIGLAPLLVFAGAGMIDAWTNISLGWVWAIIAALAIIGIIACYLKELRYVINRIISPRDRKAPSFKVIDDSHPPSKNYANIKPSELLSITRRFPRHKHREFLEPFIGVWLIIEGRVLEKIQEKGTTNTIVLIKIGRKGEACLRFDQSNWDVDKEMADKIRAEGIFKNIDDNMIFLDECEMLNEG